MPLHSQCHHTDLFFEKHSGEIIERDDYIIVRTPEKQDYYWGNYLIFRERPTLSDAALWTKQFDDAFKSMDGIEHRSLSWDVRGLEPPLDPEVIQAFVSAGYGYIPNICHELGVLTTPTYMNDDISIRPITTEQEWAEVLNAQFLCWVKDFEPVSFLEFKRWQVQRWKTLVEMGKGIWFGAFQGEQHVGNAGVFRGDDFVRYQSVSVHPDYRKAGVCRTLIYEMSKWVSGNKGAIPQIIVSEENTSAMRAYQSLGFQPRERVEQFFYV